MLEGRWRERPVVQGLCMGLWRWLFSPAMRSSTAVVERRIIGRKVWDGPCEWKGLYERLLGSLHWHPMKGGWWEMQEASTSRHNTELNYGICCPKMYRWSPTYEFSKVSRQIPGDHQQLLVTMAVLPLALGAGCLWIPGMTQVWSRRVLRSAQATERK